MLRTLSTCQMRHSHLIHHHGQGQPGRGRGKRVATLASGSRGSKRTRSDSIGEALHRLADLRVKSSESKAQKQREREAMSARACIELVKSDGHLFSSDVYHMGVLLFSDPYFCEFFLGDAITPEMRVYYIRFHYAMKFPNGGGFFPPPSCSGGWFPPGGTRYDGGDGGTLGMMVLGEPTELQCVEWVWCFC
jgi:hypothetical protein